MKYTIILCIFFIIEAENLLAQTITIRGGLNSVWFTHAESASQTKLGGHGAILIEVFGDNNFSFESGVMLNIKGGGEKFSGSIFTTQFTANFDTQSLHLELPALLKYGVPIGKDLQFTIGAGFYTSFGVSGWARLRLLDVDSISVIDIREGLIVADLDWNNGIAMNSQNRFELGEMISLGFETPKMVLGVSYMSAITSRSKYGNVQAFRNLTAFLGFKFEVHRIFSGD